MQHPDRRQDPRFALIRPVKLQCHGSGRYYGGQTYNYSASGALLVVDAPPRLLAGQRVRLGIAWNPQDTLLRSDQLVEAAIVRNLTVDGRQHIAVQFELRVPLRATA